MSFRHLWYAPCAYHVQYNLIFHTPCRHLRLICSVCRNCFIVQKRFTLTVFSDMRSFVNYNPSVELLSSYYMLLYVLFLHIPVELLLCCVFVEWVSRQ
jgi:hypothetical protein